MAASGKVRRSSGETIASAQAANLAWCLATIREARSWLRCRPGMPLPFSSGAGTLAHVGSVRSSAMSASGYVTIRAVKVVPSTPVRRK